jgi:hypothetical protein
LIRFIKPITGRSRRYILFALPLNSGMKSAPRINIADGGTGLIIVVFFPFYEGPQDIFCDEYQDNEGDKSKYSVKTEPVFPGEERMFGDEQFEA